MEIINFQRWTFTRQICQKVPVMCCRCLRLSSFQDFVLFNTSELLYWAWQAKSAINGLFPKSAEHNVFITNQPKYIIRNGGSPATWWHHLQSKTENCVIWTFIRSFFSQEVFFLLLLLVHNEHKWHMTQAGLFFCPHVDQTSPSVRSTCVTPTCSKSTCVCVCPPPWTSHSPVTAVIYGLCARKQAWWAHYSCVRASFGGCVETKT